ncbi:hypothetical protein L6452_03545 [Arctium lappa]|uniref:Uncharacterized protein n=1 Tax=Arctium lappa TaxID=4217 RepID=A0ACB9FNJ0_ARCLA|nr:hypothetical protein L6452_03545 [Arctium lappa]
MSTGAQSWATEMPIHDLLYFEYKRFGSCNCRFLYCVSVFKKTFKFSCNWHLQRNCTRDRGMCWITEWSAANAFLFGIQWFRIFLFLDVHGMNFTTDKLRSLVKKWQSLIEAHADVNMFAFIKKRANQQKRTCYAQSSRYDRFVGREIMVNQAQSISDCYLQAAHGICGIIYHTLRLLVYEYVDNGNLEQWLHRDVGPISPLTWDIRMKIAVGTAKGEVLQVVAFNTGIAIRQVYPPSRTWNLFTRTSQNPFELASSFEVVDVARAGFSTWVFLLCLTIGFSFAHWLSLAWRKQGTGLNFQLSVDAGYVSNRTMPAGTNVPVVAYHAFLLSIGCRLEE